MAEAAWQDHKVVDVHSHYWSSQYMALLKVCFLENDAPFSSGLEWMGKMHTLDRLVRCSSTYSKFPVFRDFTAKRQDSSNPAKSAASDTRQESWLRTRGPVLMYFHSKCTAIQSLLGRLLKVYKETADLGPGQPSDPMRDKSLGPNFLVS